MNFVDDSVSMLGEKLNVVVTSSGHYSLPLNNQHKILEDVEKKNTKITLSVKAEDNMQRIAKKLHAQFSHPPAHRLIRLVQNSGMKNKDELIIQIKKVSDDCGICREYKTPSPRPIVGMNMATEFNEVVAMDLKFFNGSIILHLIDHLSRFSAAAIVKSKKAEEIIEKFFEIWVQNFGPPKKFFCDNGGEFNNEQFREMCDRMNIVIKTTAAESRWSNGLCERHNGVLAEMLTKTMTEGNLSMKVALHAKVLHAKVGNLSMKDS